MLSALTGVESGIGELEAIIHRDVGRGMDAVFEASRGGLWRAASALAGMPAPTIGLITGFFVPGANPPAAETDGPAGAALMALGFINAGLSCRLATDTICESACRVALDAAGAGSVPIDAVPPGQPVDALIDLWRQQGIDRVIAIERCGPASDGRLKNMRGADIGAHAAPLDRLFSAGPWRTIGIGDGGNELGMGTVPAASPGLMGDPIGCVVPADALIAAGVSHWGAYAMLAALMLLRPDWAAAMRLGLDPALDSAVIRTMVRDGPAVDGITLRRDVTIDGLGMDVHQGVLAALRGAVGG